MATVLKQKKKEIFISLPTYEGLIIIVSSVTTGSSFFFYIKSDIFIRIFIKNLVLYGNIITVQIFAEVKLIIP